MWVWQGSTIFPTLFNIYVTGQLTFHQITVADYTDDKVSMEMSENPLTTSSNLKLHFYLMSYWYDKKRIKINQSKSIHTLRLLSRWVYVHPLYTINNIQISTSDTVKHLRLNLDKPLLTWKNHIYESKY